MTVVPPVGRSLSKMDENPYQPPMTNEDGGAAPRRGIRFAAMGLCFLVALMLCANPIYSPVYEGIAFLGTYGFRHAISTRSGLGSLMSLAWGGVSAVSCVVVGIGLFCARTRLSAVGGCILALATAFYVVGHIIL